MEKLNLFINGAEKSFYRKKTLRQRIIIAENRKKYTCVTQALKQWRDKRKIDDVSDITYRYTKFPQLTITEKDYAKIRNYLIVELIIPNGQRPGTISGMTVDEVILALEDVTPEGYHRIIVSNHKIGHISNATLFVYPIFSIY